MEAARSRIKPAFESRALAPFRKDENAESQLPQNHGVDGDVAFIGSQPGDDARIRRRLGGLAQDVRVDKVCHAGRALQRVGRLGIDGDKEVLVRAREQPVYGALIGRRRSPGQAVFALIQTLDIELLSGFDVIDAADFGGQDDSAFRGNPGFHKREPSQVESSAPGQAAPAGLRARRDCPRRRPETGGREARYGGSPALLRARRKNRKLGRRWDGLRRSGRFRNRNRARGRPPGAMRGRNCECAGEPRPRPQQEVRRSRPRCAPIPSARLAGDWPGCGNTRRSLCGRARLGTPTRWHPLQLPGRARVLLAGSGRGAWLRYSTPYSTLVKVSGPPPPPRPPRPPPPP